MAISNNPLFNQTGGKIGSLVVGRNGVIRERVYRNASQSEAQMRQRASLAGLSGSWRQLSDAQRGLWGRLEAQMNVVKPGKASGYRTYMAVNGTLLACGKPILANAPATPDAPATLPPLYISAGIDSGDFKMYVRSAAYAGMVQVYATPPMSPGRNSFGPSDFRLVMTLPVLETGGTPFGNEYAALFGVPALGLKTAVTLYPVSAHGFRGDPIKAQASFIENPAVQAAPAPKEATPALRAA